MDEGVIKKAARKLDGINKHHPEKYQEIKKYGDKFLATFQPLRRYLLLQGQLPFPIKNYETRPSAFVGNWLQPMGIAYLCFLTFSVLSFSLLSFGFFTFFVPSIINLKPIQINVTQENLEQIGTFIQVPKDWEKETIRKSFTPFLVFYLMGAYLIVMNVTVLIRRTYFLDYLNYWLFSIQIMQMEVPRSVYRKLILELFLAVGVIVLLLGLNVARIVESATGLIDIMSYLLLRPAHYYYGFPVPREVLTRDRTKILYYVYKAPGMLILVTFYVGGRLGIIHFMFYTRLLSSVSKTWNQRLRDGLANNQQEIMLDAEGNRILGPPKIRLGLSELLEDHFTIVQLYKMTEDLFGWQLIIYYFLQSVGMIFQFYHMVSVYPSEKVIDDRWPTKNVEETRGILIKRLDSVPANDEYSRAFQEFFAVMVTSFLTCVYVFITTDCAHDAYVEGMGGFQILRRNCYLGNCDSTSERNFIHTLVVSFAPHNPIMISADGYFDINRTLVSAVILNVMGYLVAAYTLKPDTTEFWNFGQYANLCRPKHPDVTCP